MHKLFWIKDNDDADPVDGFFSSNSDHVGKERKRRRELIVRPEYQIARQKARGDEENIELLHLEFIRLCTSYTVCFLDSHLWCSKGKIFIKSYKERNK